MKTFNATIGLVLLSTILLSTISGVATAQAETSKVTGNGWFYGGSEARNKFKIHVAEAGEDVSGYVNYLDRKVGYDFQGFEIRYLIRETARPIVLIKGYGRLNGDTLHYFEVEVVDGGKPGKQNDVFSIKIWFAMLEIPPPPEPGDPPAPTPVIDPIYESKGWLGGGNIKIS